MKRLVGHAVWLLVLTVTWLLLSCGLFLTKAEPMDSKVREALSRNVRVETARAWGTGVVIQTGVVLTNYHVIEDNTPVTIDGHEAKVVSRSPEKDLAILHYEDFHYSPTASRLEFCSQKHEQSDEVFWVGNPAGMRNFVVFGRIIGYQGEDIYTDASPLPGFSGSALYCREHGRCLGINNRLYGSVGMGAPYAITIPAKTTKKFLGEK